MPLISHYRLNGDANDSIGGANGTPTGVSWVDGKLGGAADFDGNGTTVIETHQQFNFFAEGQFSVAFWVNPLDMSDKATAAAGLVGKGHWYDNGWDVFMRNTNRVSFELSGDPTRTGVRSVTSGVLPLNEWSHITCTYSNGLAKLYLNGVFVNDAMYITTSGDFDGNRPVNIGRRYTDTSRVLRGKMDDVRIYDHALSRKEVGQLARGTILHYPFPFDVGSDKVISDASGQGKDAAVPTTATWISDVPVGSGGYAFNGDNIIDVGEGLPIQDHSLCFWLRVKTDPTGSWNRKIFENSSARNPHIWFSNTSQNLHWNLTAVGQSNVSVNTSVGFQKDTWYFVCGTWSQADPILRVYIGSPQREGNVAFHQAGTRGTDGDVLSSGGGNLRFMGGSAVDWDIADARFYATQLTPDEVKELYQQRASLDNVGNFHTANICENSYMVAHRPTQKVGNSFETLDFTEGKSYGVHQYINTLTNANTSTWYEYRFYVEESGTYTIEGFVLTPDGTRDSFMMSIDGESFVEWHTGQYAIWSWSTWDTRALTIGWHSLRVGPRESDSAISIINIHKNGLKVLPGHPVTIDKNLNGNFSEIGPAKNMEGYYPLIKDERDMSGNGAVSTNQGGVPTGNGYSFDGTSYVRSTSPLSPTASSISAWLLKRAHAVNSYPIFLSFHLPYIACNSSTVGFRLSYISGSTGSQTNLQGQTVPALNQWYHVTATFSSDAIRLYVNGVLDASTTNVAGGTNGGDFSIGRHGTGSQYSIDGKVRDVRTYLKTLSPEEVNILYEMTKPDSPQKMKQTKDTLYIHGQFKEV